MKALRRKLLRDLWHLRGQVVAIGLVVACGVATLVTTRTAYDSLVVSREAYYGQYRFAAVFAGLKRAPEGLAAEIEAIPGVAAVRTRLVFDVTLDVPGLREPATASSRIDSDNFLLRCFFCGSSTPFDRYNGKVKYMRYGNASYGLNQSLKMSQGPREMTDVTSSDLYVKARFLLNQMDLGLYTVWIATKSTGQPGPRDDIRRI